jgi:hypothetical protein
MRVIELKPVADAECATCNERVNWATHTAAECRNTLWRQRNEAREVAGELWHYVDPYYVPVEYADGYPWLKETSKR